MVTDDGVTGSVVVPQSISGRLERHAVTAAARAESFNAVRDKLAWWLDERGPLPYRDGYITGEAVRRWRSPARLAAVAIAWRDDPSRSEIAGVLEEWRSADRKVWDGQEHGRRRALGYRDDLYRQVGALVASQAARVVVDDINVAAIAGSRRIRDDVRAGLQQLVGRRRFHAAPSRLRDAITAAARGGGLRVDVVPGKRLSRVHAACGHENPADDRYASPPVTCEGCGAQYDPDESATLLMLRAAEVL